MAEKTSSFVSPEEDDVDSDAEQHGHDTVADQVQVPPPALLPLLG